MSFQQHWAELQRNGNLVEIHILPEEDHLYSTCRILGVGEEWSRLAVFDPNFGFDGFRLLRNSAPFKMRYETESLIRLSARIAGDTAFAFDDLPGGPLTMESFLACSTVAKSLVEIAAAHEIHMGNVCDYNEDCIVLHEFDEDHLTCDGKLLIRTDDIDYFAVHTQYLAVREKAARSLDALNA